MPGYNVDDYSTSGFVQKDDLKAERPVRIKDVDSRDAPAKDGKPSRPELVLVFTDDSKLGLRTAANRDTLKEAFGKMTDDWIGKVIVLYVDPSVRSPTGARVGGIRIRIPAQDGGPVAFQSDLEPSEPEPEPETADPEKVPF